MILQQFLVNQSLTHSMRNTLASVIIKHELKDGLDAKITKNRFIDLAKGNILYGLSDCT